MSYLPHENFRSFGTFNFHIFFQPIHSPCLFHSAGIVCADLTEKLHVSSWVQVIRPWTPSPSALLIKTAVNFRSVEFGRRLAKELQLQPTPSVQYSFTFLFNNSGGIYVATKSWRGAFSSQRSTQNLVRWSFLILQPAPLLMRSALQLMDFEILEHLCLTPYPIVILQWLPYVVFFS